MLGNFSFEGFEPDNELKTFSKEIFWLMEDKAPSQSAKTANLVKFDDHYEAKIKIHSSSGIFVAEDRNVDAHACVEGVYLKVKEILKTWAKNRLPEIDDQEIA